MPSNATSDMNKVKMMNDQPKHSKLFIRTTEKYINKLFIRTTEKYINNLFITTTEYEDGFNVDR